MANSFNNDFTITNISDLKGQYKKGAAFYHLKAAKFEAGDYMIVADDGGNTDGTSTYQHLSFGDATTDSAMSIALWFKLDGAPRGHLVSKVGQRAEWDLSLDSDYKLNMRFYDNGIATAETIWITSSSGISDYITNRWAHIVVTYNGAGTHRAGGGGEAPDYGVTSMYINGSQITVGDAATGTSYTAMHTLVQAPVVIGSIYGDGNGSDGLLGAVGSQLTGSFAELAFFKKELRSSEVSELYNLYFNTHYKDLKQINVPNIDGNALGGQASDGDPEGETPLFYRSPIYDFSLCASSSAAQTGFLSSAFLFGNGMSGSLNLDTHDARRFGGHGKLLRSCYNTSLSSSAYASNAHVRNEAKSSGTSHPEIIPTCSRVMDESESAFPTNRKADIIADPPIILNTPGPGRLRGRSTPYKVTKK